MIFKKEINFIYYMWFVYKDDSFSFTFFFHSIKYIFHIPGEFTAFEVAKCHVIYLSTNYLVSN